MHTLFKCMLALACAGASVGALAQASAGPGDAVRGKALYEAKCNACHSVDENRVGPRHMGVLGRKAGSVKDYEYSDALIKSNVVWTRQNLLKWLTEPEDLIPGQRMGYRLGEAKDRADVVAYLATLK